jgi:hypothetical protein
MKAANTSILLLTSFVCLTCLSATHAAPAATKPVAKATKATKVRVAILDFETGGKASLDFMKQVPDALAAMLSDDAAIQLVERAQVAKTIQEQAANLTGLVDAEKSVKVGKLLGAQVLVTGKIFPLDRDLYVTVKLIGTETSAVKVLMVKGKADADIGELLMSVAEKVGTTLKTQAKELLPDGGPLDPLPGLKTRLAGKRKPTLSVAVSERHQAAARAIADPAVETELRRMLIECGFTVLDNANKDRKADLAVTGEAFSEFGALLGNLTACTARVELKVTDVRGGTIRFTDRTTARAADLSEAIAAKSALQKGGYNLAVQLLEHFADSLPDEKAKPAAP